MEMNEKREKNCSTGRRGEAATEGPIGQPYLDKNPARSIWKATEDNARDEILEPYSNNIGACECLGTSPPIGHNYGRKCLTLC